MRENIVSNDANMSNEIMSEVGSPDLPRDNKVIGNLG